MLGPSFSAIVLVPTMQDEGTDLRAESTRPHSYNKAYFIERRCPVLNYAMVFLVLGVVAWGLFWAGVPGIPIQISWILSSTGIVLLMMYLVTGRTASRSS